MKFVRFIVPTSTKVQNFLQRLEHFFRIVRYESFPTNTILTKPPPNFPFLSPWFPVNSFQVDPENSKALYRRGLATKSDRPDEAEKDFMKAWQVRVDKRDDDG